MPSFTAVTHAPIMRMEGSKTENRPPVDVQIPARAWKVRIKDKTFIFS
jgi:hypothetical protein